MLAWAGAPTSVPPAPSSWRSAASGPPSSAVKPRSPNSEKPSWCNKSTHLAPGHSAQSDSWLRSGWGSVLAAAVYSSRGACNAQSCKNRPVARLALLESVGSGASDARPESGAGLSSMSGKLVSKGQPACVSSGRAHSATNWPSWLNSTSTRQAMLSTVAVPNTRDGGSLGGSLGRSTSSNLMACVAKMASNVAGIPGVFRASTKASVGATGAAGTPVMVRAHRQECA